MTQFADPRAQAKQLCDAGQFEDAGKLYHQLWDEHGDAFSGSRYVHCLRKAGHAKAAVTTARMVVEKHPDDVYVRRELVWALYEAEFKPAKERSDLAAMTGVGSQIAKMTDEELPLRLVAFPIISLAKEKGKWIVVSQWCDHLDRNALDIEPREIDGRRVISEQEQWYYAKVKSLVELRKWDEARALGLEAVHLYPRDRDFARWTATALAGQGQVNEATAELEALVAASRKPPEWYLLSDLAELKRQLGQRDEAYRLACQAALAYGEDKAKVNLFVVVGHIAHDTQRFDVALRHAVLSRLVRAQEGWSVPADVIAVERQARSALQQSGQPAVDLPNELAAVRSLCKQDWQQAVPFEARPQPRPKPPRSGVTSTDSPTYTGCVKTYKQDRGFGFIVPDDGGVNIFFHISQVQGIDLPEEGMSVQYEIADGPKGPNAVNVRLAPG